MKQRPPLGLVFKLYILLFILATPSRLLAQSNIPKKTDRSRSNNAETLGLQTSNNPRLSRLNLQGGSSTGGGNAFLLSIPVAPQSGREAYLVLREVQSIAESVYFMLLQLQGEAVTGNQNYQKLVDVLHLSPEAAAQFALAFKTTGAGINRIGFNANIQGGNHAQFDRRDRSVDLDPVSIDWLREDINRYVLLVYHEVLGLMGHAAKDLKSDGYPATSALREVLLSQPSILGIVIGNLAIVRNEVPRELALAEKFSQATQDFIDQELPLIWGSFASPSALQSQLIDASQKLKSPQAARTVRLVPLSNLQDSVSRAIYERETQEALSGQVILVNPTLSQGNIIKDNTLGAKDALTSFGAHLLVAKYTSSYLQSSGLKYTESLQSARQEFAASIYYIAQELVQEAQTRPIWTKVREQHAKFSSPSSEKIAVLMDQACQATSAADAKPILDALYYQASDIEAAFQVVEPLLLHWIALVSKSDYSFALSDWQFASTSAKDLLHKNWRRLNVVTIVANTLDQLAKLDQLKDFPHHEVRILLSYEDLPIAYTLLDYLRVQSGGAIDLKVDRSILDSDTLGEIIPSKRKGQSFQYSGDDFKDFMNGIPR